MPQVKSPLSERISAEKLLKCAEMLKAIAHPIRMSIVDLLGTNPRMTVTEIYEQVGVEQAVASHHLGILREVGLLLAERNGKNTYYSLAMEDVLTVIKCVERCQHAM
jgi:DNA-binding transcriptional ArsR family regulator